MGTDDHVPESDTQSLLMEAAYHRPCEYGEAEFSLRTGASASGKSRGVVHYESKNDILAPMLDSRIE